MRLAKLLGICALIGMGGSHYWITTALSEPNIPPGDPGTVMNHDGIYQVGVDILPGIYRTAGGADDTACYWKRSQGDQMLDNGLSRKPQVVHIDPTDTSFKTHHCQPWELTECPPDCPPSDKVDIRELLKGFFPQPDRVAPSGPDEATP